MERESKREIDDDSDRNRNHVVAPAADRDRRSAGISPAFERYPVEHRPTQE